MFSLPLSGYRCLGDFAAAFFLRPNRMVTGFVASSVSTFSTARFRLFDRGVTSRRKLPTATFRRPPRLHEPDGVSAAVPMAATSTSGFFFLRLARVLVRFAVAVRFGLAFLTIRTAYHELQHVVRYAKNGSIDSFLSEYVLWATGSVLRGGTRSRLRRMAAAAPAAWYYDSIFHWSTIGAGIALVLFVLRLAESPAPHTQVSAPASSAPAIPGPTYGASTVGSPLAPPVSTALPKIAPGRSLDGVTITPAPEHDRFGTLPLPTRK